MPGVWVFPGGSVDAGRRRGRGRPTAPARCASSPRRPGSSCRPSEELVLFSPLDHAGGRSPPASTPGSTSPSPPPTRRPRPTGSRPSRRAGSSPPRRSRPHEAGELVLAFPTHHPARAAGRARAPPTRRSPPTAARTVEPILPVVVGTPRGRPRRPPRRPRLPALTARLAARCRLSASGNGSSPACQGPGG